jgi:hypothetical protein
MRDHIAGAGRSLLVFLGDRREQEADIAPRARSRNARTGGST